MKKGIHPAIYKTVVTCSCGASFETISTRENLRVDMCSKCHPYFTGKKKMMDTGGRVDRFKKRYEGSSGAYQFSEETSETVENEKESTTEK